MKHIFIKRAVSLLLALVCILGLLPLDVFAADGLSDAPSTITQVSSDYMYVGGRPIRYEAASDVINNVGRPYVFDEQVNVPGYGTTRALCAYQQGTLGSGANGQKWDFKKEVTHPSLKALLTFVYSHTYGDYTEAGEVRGLPTWGPKWSDIWFMVAQSMTWYCEHGILIDYNTDKEGFIRQAAEEFVAVFRMCHDSWNSSAWITDWDAVDIHTIIDSSDNGITGNSAYDYVSTGFKLVTEHPEYFHTYHLWEYEWDDSQPWRLPGQQGTPMQRLLTAVPEPESKDIPVSLTVKKLEAGSNKPLAGVTFKVENAVNPQFFSVTRTTGTDGTFTLTQAADKITPGQYRITEVAAPEGYVPQTAAQTVTVMPDSTADSTFTFYNVPTVTGSGSIRKVDSDNPTVGIPGAVIKITSVKLDDGGSFTGTYTTKDGGYISDDDLDFSTLPTGSYVAQEITPPQGYILSTDPAKVRQTFVWDGKHDVSLVFENDSKVKVQLKKVDESGQPLAGAIFLVLKDGQIIATEETKADGTITVSNVSEGYYEFVEVSAPAGFDCDRTPVGVHVDAKDLQGEQTITVTKVNHHKRSLTIEKKDAETGKPVSGTVFHIRGVNVTFEQDITTGADGNAVLKSMPSGCYEVTETSVPAPYLLDANNRKTVWIEAEQDKDVTVTFTNSTKPGLRLVKKDHETGKPIAGVTFLIQQVGGGYSGQHITDSNGLIVLENLEPGAYTVTEVKPAPGYVADATPRTVWLEKDRTTALELTNVRKPDLRILKYDQQSGKPLAGVTFEVWHNSELLGEYTTDKNGEIYLSGLELGTYLVKEVATDDDHVVNSTPQQIELTADRTETAQLVFFNSLKPGLHLIKVDSVTMKPLANVRFSIKKVGGSYAQEFTTDANGEIDLSKLGPGAYEIRELEAPDGYLIDDAVRTVQINPDETASFVFTNSAKPGLRLVKTDHDTGKPIAGVTFLIQQVGGGYSEQHITDENGLIVLENLEPGAYTVTEVKPAPGYVADVTPRTVWLEKDRTTTLELTNVRKPDLRILKYDQQSGKPLAGVTFEVWHDSELLGEYTTDASGEIYLSGLELGTYLVKEVATDDDHVVNSTPQQIELTADRTETAQLVFFNSLKPGLHLIKVDSVTMKSLPNVRFEFKLVGGSYRQEFTTDANGEIDLSKLTPGAYEVRELKAPDGYLIDDAVRVVQINPDETASFVFANTPKPSLRLIKTSSDGSRLAGVHFRIAKIEDGSHYLDRITDADGEINISGLEPGVYSIKETATTSNHILDTREYHVELIAGQASTIALENQKRPSLTIRKTDKDTGDPISGVTFTLRGADGPTITTEPTGPDGTVRIADLLPGVYTVAEQSIPESYLLDSTPQTVTLLPNWEATVAFQNYKRPTLKIAKVDIDGKPLTGAIFEVKTKAGVKIGDFPVGADGTVTIPNVQLDEGYYIVTEKQAPAGYILDPTPHEVYLRPGKTTELTIENEKKPGLTIYKVDSVVGDGIKGAKFEIYVSKDKDPDGTYRKLGSYYSDKNGIIRLEDLDTGWYRIVEVEPPAGYLLKEPSEQTVYVEHDKAVEVTFENVPKSALVIRKIDATTGEPLADAWFRVRYLGGASGSGGTVIGEYQTSANGNIIVTGLGAGTYVCEEVSAPHGYVMDTAPQTAYISGKEQDCITLTFTNSKYGALLIKKVDAITGEPLGGVAFSVTDSSGSAVGGGTFTTDSAGTILIPEIKPGTTLVVKETRAKAGYVLDDTAQTALIRSGETTTLEFCNQPEGSLLIRKVCATNPSVTLQNAEFKVTYADGTLIGDSNGVYRTDEAGEIRISGLTPGKSVVVTETRAPAGFIIDTQSQTIQIKEGRTVSLTFKNQPKGKLIIQKRDSATGQPLPGAEFRITTAAGCEVGLDGVIGTSTLTSNGIFTTDANGEIRISNLAPGVYVLTEIKAPDGYVIDTPSTNVVIGQGGDTQTVVVKNSKLGNLVIHKLDSVTGKPLAGVQFKVTYADSKYVDAEGGKLSSNGLYTTDKNGQIVISGIVGTVIVTETRTLPGYTIDPDTHSQTVVVNPNDTQKLTFYNAPKQTLTIQKYVDGTTTPIQGVTFLVTDSSGAVVGPNNGEYVTDRNGRIVLTGLTPGTTITARETRTAAGFVLDSTPQSIRIKDGEAQRMTFFNKAVGGVEIVKVSEADKTQRIPGVTFEIRRMDGGLVDTVTTDKNGRVYLPLDAGSYYAVEIETVKGFQLDSTPHYFTVKDGKTATLTVTNKPLSGIVIHKTDSTTGKGIYGVTFVLYDSGRNPIGEYTSDQSGYVYIDDLTVQGNGRFYLRELEAAPGYELDKQYKTVYVKAGETIDIEWENTPVTGQIQVYKYAAAYNDITGVPAGTPLQGAVYEISEARSGKVVDHITTDARGVAASKPLPLGRYKLKEVTAPAYFLLDATVFDETLEYSGQIIKVSAHDKPVKLNVSITKRGNAEVLAGSQMRYDFTVSNGSNVPLEGFFWHDRIPTDAARAVVFTTGTYSARLNYRVLYKTNYSAQYQVLASNLLTSSNYSFSLSAIPMQAGEYITDIRLDFGKVPAGFQSVTKPTLTVQVLGTAVNGYRIVNRADVGGKYLETWQTAQATWLTIVRRYTHGPTLPQTGY